ncbi:MAG: hypothetical protein SFW09_05195 [Hyphomicrobiaceae bacterium]|nr:hypothetical protein [Hyphomicrobiaceae bacterium]
MRNVVPAIMALGFATASAIASTSAIAQTATPEAVGVAATATQIATVGPPMHGVASSVEHTSAAASVTTTAGAGSVVRTPRSAEDRSSATPVKAPTQRAAEVRIERSYRATPRQSYGSGSRDIGRFWPPVF